MCAWIIVDPTKVKPKTRLIRRPTTSNSGISWCAPLELMVMCVHAPGVNSAEADNSPMNSPRYLCHVLNFAPPEATAAPALRTDAARMLDRRDYFVSVGYRNATPVVSPG